MKRITLAILILGILGFSLLAITGLSYAEDTNRRFAQEFAKLYGEVSRQLDPNTAAVFKDEVKKILETMPPIVKKEIAKIEDDGNPRKETYGIVERDKIAEREERERYTQGGSGNNSNGGNNGGGATTGGSSVNVGGNTGEEGGSFPQ